MLVPVCSTYCCTLASRAYIARLQFQAMPLGWWASASSAAHNVPQLLFRIVRSTTTSAEFLKIVARRPRPACISGTKSTEKTLSGIRFSHAGGPNMHPVPSHVNSAAVEPSLQFRCRTGVRVKWVKLDYPKQNIAVLSKGCCIMALQRLCLVQYSMGGLPMDSVGSKIP